jgi:hypothetical protein
MFKELNEQLQKFLEVKPTRAWNGKLEKIGELIDWMYSKNILTETDKKKKDSLFHKYYRFYNDGDFPKGLKGNTYNAYDYKYVQTYLSRENGHRKEVELDVETALETQLEEFIKYVLSKYLPKINRKEFHKDIVMRAYDDVLEKIINKDPHGLFYWITKLPQEAQEQIDISELKDLLNQYQDIAKNIPDERSWGNLGDKIYNYGRNTVLDKKPESAEIISKIDKKLIDLEVLVRNMKKAALQLWSIEDSTKNESNLPDIQKLDIICINRAFNFEFSNYVGRKNGKWGIYITKFENGEHNYYIKSPEFNTQKEALQWFANKLLNDYGEEDLYYAIKTGNLNIVNDDLKSQLGV